MNNSVLRIELHPMAGVREGQWAVVGRIDSYDVNGFPEPPKEFNDGIWNSRDVAIKYAKQRMDGYSIKRIVLGDTEFTEGDTYQAELTGADATTTEQ